MRTREEIALNFEVPISQYCEIVKEAWDITKEEEKKKTKKREDVFNDRLNIVSQFQNKIYEGAGELIDYCLPLISQNKDMLLDDFFKEMSGQESGSPTHIKANDRWDSCLNLFNSYYGNLLFYEQNEQKGLCKYTFNGQTVFRETNVNGEPVSFVEASPFIANVPAVGYCERRDTFEYRLCNRLCEYINNKLKNGEKVKVLLVRLLLTVCLYMALENEKEKIKFFTNIFVPKSDKATEEEVTEVELPEELDTEEGRELLQKVINAGFCDKNYNWDETKWRDGEDVLALACFAYMANKKLDLIRKQGRKEIISWKPFDTLFTYRKKLNKESGKTQLQITMTNYKQKKRFTAFIVPNHIRTKLAPLFDKH